MNQLSLYKILKKNSISVKHHILLCKIYAHKKIDINKNFTMCNELHKKGFIDKNINITEEGKSLIEKIETIFKKQPKSIKNILGDDYKENIKTFRNMFPSIKLPNGKYAKSSEKNLETKFKLFFSNYNYTWKVIFKATRLYILEFEQKNWKFMRTSQYFIIKDNTSDLADYCERIMSGEKIENNNNNFNQKVV